MRAFALMVYRRLLYWLDLAERRCMTCKKLLGYTAGLRPRLVGVVTHGLCARCAAALEAETDAAVRVIRQHRAWRQRPLRKTLRRRTGGWSGAVAMQGRVSH